LAEPPGSVEHGPQRQVDAELGTHPAQQRGGQQRVAAEVEEAVGRADAVAAQCLRPDRGEPSLGAGARRHERRRDVLLAGGQPPFVHLAVRGQRQRVQHHDPGGHQVLRQAGAEEGAQLLRVGGRGVRGRHDVAHEALPAADHHRLADRGVPAQRGLHLGGLDPMAPDLELAVHPAEELQPPVGA